MELLYNYANYCWSLPQALCPCVLINEHTFNLQISSSIQDFFPQYQAVIIPREIHTQYTPNIPLKNLFWYCLNSLLSLPFIHYPRLQIVILHFSFFHINPNIFQILPILTHYLSVPPPTFSTLLMLLPGLPLPNWSLISNSLHASHQSHRYTKAKKPL